MIRPLRILFLEDRPTDYELELRELRTGGIEITAVRVETESQYIRHLEEFAPDVIIADYKLPSYDGFSALEAARRLCADVPFIFVSGTLGEDLAIEALKRGATDYVLKQRLLRLRPAVERAIRDAGEEKKHRQAEARILHLNQLLHAIRDINSLMVKQRDPERLLSDACNILVRTRGYQLVWVGYIKTGSVRVIPVARAGPAADYVDDITVTWDESPTGQGPVGKAIRDQVPCVINNAATDPSFAPWRKAALDRGCGSVAALPLIQGKHPLGALTVYADMPEAFDQEEMDLLSELAGDLSFALHSIGNENERRRAEEKLLAQTRTLSVSELRYRELFENANDIIYTLDLDGNFTSLNKAGEQILGFTHEQVMQMNIDQVIAPEYLAQAQENLRRTIAGEPLAPAEFVIIGKQGRRTTIEVNNRAVVRDHKPIGVQGIARNLSERNLLQKQLMQAQKMEAIGHLAGGIAHDFNNLLTVIIGYSDFLLGAVPAEDPAHADIDQIKRAGTRAADLTSQLLAFSRRQILQPRVVDLNVLVQESSKLLRRLIGENIELIIRTAPDLGSIKADVAQMEQIIMNLAVNARDAMPNGGRLTLETANIELDQTFVGSHLGSRQGKFVMLAASDTGTGMDVQTKSHLFEPFFTTKEEGKGTGLGLATVYGIVKQSGGYITVDSEPGCGATLKVYLPLVDEAAMTAEPLELATSDGTETILLVEDVEEVRDLAQRSLQARGYCVLPAGNGPSATKLASEYTGTIHLLVTDLIMPGGINGRDLADRLEITRPGIKVLFISGYASAVGIGNVLDPQIAFFQKPFTGADLARKVREVLQRE
jgi:PAS domain S-box-containing protein